MTAIFGLIEFIPRWLLLAALAGMAALSVKLQIDVAGARGETIRANKHVAIMESLLEKAATKAAEDSRAMQEKVTEAQNEARKRETNLRAAAAAAADQLDGLRVDLDATRDQLAGATREAAIERSVAVGAVLQECGRRYTGLAAKADRHVSDIRTLIDAWPK